MPARRGWRLALRKARLILTNDALLASLFLIITLLGAQGAICFGLVRRWGDTRAVRIVLLHMPGQLVRSARGRKMGDRLGATERRRQGGILIVTGYRSCVVWSGVVALIEPRPRQGISAGRNHRASRHLCGVIQVVRMAWPWFRLPKTIRAQRLTGWSRCRRLSSGIGFRLWGGGVFLGVREFAHRV